MEKLIRAVTYYNKADEEFVGEIILPPNSLEKLQKIFKRPKKDKCMKII